VVNPGFVGFVKGRGVDHGERTPSLNGGPGAEPLVGGQGVKQSPTEVESFWSIFIQKVAKS